MATTIKRVGFGQVEPNHLSAQRTGQIYAQLPAHIKGETMPTGTTAGNADTIAQLENGQFVKYDYANNEVNFYGEGEWMLVFNEVKLYDGLRETYKDFALQAKDFYHATMYPRVFKTNVGDIYTTNCIGAAGAKGAEYAGIALDVDDKLIVNASGFLVKAADAAAVTAAPMAWQVVKVYTMADGQPAVKVMRIK